MPKTLFIGDLHLDKKHPEATRAFLDYLQLLQTEYDNNHTSDNHIDALYILGDLFEYWLGDDCIDATAKRVADALSQFHERTNTPIYFTHGNRDFLIGHDFSARCQWQLLPEHHVINLYEIRTLVLHGDTLCTDDLSYMRFRERVHSPTWQAKLLRLPVIIRRAIALYLRFQSQRMNSKKSAAIMDVAPDAVANVVREYEVLQLIHGHTHRPKQHDEMIDNQHIRRHVVGDWYTQGSVLAVTPEGAKLLTLPFTADAKQ